MQTRIKSREKHAQTLKHTVENIDPFKGNLRKYRIKAHILMKINLETNFGYLYVYLLKTTNHETSSLRLRLRLFMAILNVFIWATILHFFFLSLLHPSGEYKTVYQEKSHCYYLTRYLLSPQTTRAIDLEASLVLSVPPFPYSFLSRLIQH